MGVRAPRAESVFFQQKCLAAGAQAHPTRGSKQAFMRHHSEVGPAPLLAEWPAEAHRRCWQWGGSKRQDGMAEQRLGAGAPQVWPCLSVKPSTASPLGGCWWEFFTKTVVVRGIRAGTSVAFPTWGCPRGTCAISSACLRSLASLDPFAVGCGCAFCGECSSRPPCSLVTAGPGGAAALGLWRESVTTERTHVTCQ